MDCSIPQQPAVTTYREWAQNPELGHRLDALVDLTQRTGTLMECFEVPEEKSFIFKQHVREIIKKKGIYYKPPRGRSTDIDGARPMSNDKKFDLSVLFSILSSTNETAIGSDQAGSLASGDMVDRLIMTYLRFLHIGNTTPGTSTVSFDYFFASWKSVQQGKAEKRICRDCGSTHYSFYIAVTFQCPVCKQLGLGRAQSTSCELSA
jgi:hypothetical protein